MPYENQWTERGLCRKFTGETSGKEVLDSNLALHGDVRFDDLRYIINDFTEITGFTVSENEVTLIATVDMVAEEFNRDLNIAIVSSSEEFISWAELYCEKMKPSFNRCKIFRDLETAHQWVKERL